MHKSLDRQSRRHPGSLRLWKREILGPVASIIFLVIMALLLRTYDAKPIFSWYGVNLNAIISILSTASKATLAFSVDEAISQWKWILFGQQSRPLMDFERIDSASRGTLGSLSLIANGKFTGA